MNWWSRNEKKREAITRQRQAYRAKRGTLMIGASAKAVGSSAVAIGSGAVATTQAPEPNPAAEAWPEEIYGVGYMVDPGTKLLTVSVNVTMHELLNRLKVDYQKLKTLQDQDMPLQRNGETIQLDDDWIIVWACSMTNYGPDGVFLDYQRHRFIPTGEPGSDLCRHCNRPLDDNIHPEEV